MKVLVHSNAPWAPSGYGVQTRLLTQQMVKDHDVAISAFFGLQGSTLTWEDITIYPAGAHRFGMDVVEEHARHHFDGQRGLLLTLIDVWVLDGRRLRDLPVASWVPLDHVTLPRAIRDYFIRSEAVPIAMSQFGQGQLQSHDIDALYVPHSVDTNVFRPMDRAECRDSLSLPEDAFIVGMVAANQGQPARKGFPEAFMAMSHFMRNHSEVIFYVHTEVTGARTGGINLKQLAEDCDIPPGRVRECDQYLYRNGLLSPEYLARAYNSMDVLLNPSMGEGFGIPIVESQACGTPVIGTNTSAMTETVGVGWLCEGQRFYTHLGGFQVVPSVSEIGTYLEDAGNRAESMRDAAVGFAQRYESSTVYGRYWQPTLEEVSDRLRVKQIMEFEPV